MQIKTLFEVGLPSRFTKERVHLYLAMRKHFTKNLAYSNPDTQAEHYDPIYEEVEKMRVYRDTEDTTLFLPGGRELLARKIDMKRIEVFHKHAMPRLRL